MITIIFKYIRAVLSGKRYYIVLLEPDRVWITDRVRNMSAELIWDGFSQSMRTLMEEGVIRQKFTDEERAMIEKQREEMKAVALKEAGNVDRND